MQQTTHIPNIINSTEAKNLSNLSLSKKKTQFLKNISIGIRDQTDKCHTTYQIDFTEIKNLFKALDLLDFKELVRETLLSKSYRIDRTNKESDYMFVIWS